MIFQNFGFNQNYPVAAVGGSYTIEYLIVAGGGGGGNQGGGGAGGLISGSATVTSLQTYTINVGDGGRGSTYVGSINSVNGTNSSIVGTAVSQSAIGGGRGAFELTNINGGNGGSGGGGLYNGLGGSGSVGQGFRGGNGAGSPFGGAGGGGASQVGTNGPTRGHGGSGSFWLDGIRYAGGGGGGGTAQGAVGGTGGPGGGGNGGATGTSSGAAGTTNTGGGGGGGGNSSNPVGGKGGSGIVIIRYITADVAGTPTGGTVTTSGSYTYHKFTPTGSATYTA